jgi:hypothetical protein
MLNLSEKSKLCLKMKLKQFFRSFDVSQFDLYRDWVIARLIFDTGGFKQNTHLINEILKQSYSILLTYLM